MLLQKLKEYADERLPIPVPGYGSVAVRYLVDLDAQGCLLNPRPVDTAEPPWLRRGRPRLVPQLVRTRGTRPLLLVDKADYALGQATGQADSGKVAERHTAFLELLRRCAETTREPAVQAVLTFLDSDQVAELELGDDFAYGDLVTFRVFRGQESVLPADLPAVQAFWAGEIDPAARSAPTMQCLVCGEQRPVLERLEGKLKRVPGGQTSGTSLISANAEAFESYGLEASLIAPTCASCGKRFTEAANALLASEQQRIVLGGAVFIFWTRQPVDFPFGAFFSEPRPEDVRDYLRSPLWSKRTAEIDATAFYATVLSGSGGRAVVRDWIDTTVGEVRRHLARWFEGQRIVDWDSGEPRPLGLYALAAATVRDPRTDLAPPTLPTLLRAALLGGPLPSSLLYQAIRRNRAEQRVTRPRAALIKLALRSQQSDLTEDLMVQLDPDNLSPAYRCGRLLAELENVQRAAISNLNQTIVDRFYGTASAAPASVFGRLLRGAQPHLSKLQSDPKTRGAYHAFQQRIEDITAGLSGFPRMLSLEEQGLFALGYYHQRAEDRARMRAAAERKKAGPTTDGQTPEDGLQHLEDGE